MNSIVLTGSLVSNPVLVFLETGTAVATFAIAVTRDYKRNGDYEKDFFPCVAWKEKANFIEENFKKGDLLELKGRVIVRKIIKNEHVILKNEILVQTIKKINFEDSLEENFYSYKADLSDLSEDFFKIAEESGN